MIEVLLVAGGLALGDLGLAAVRIMDTSHSARVRIATGVTVIVVLSGAGSFVHLGWTRRNALLVVLYGCLPIAGLGTVLALQIADSGVGGRVVATVVAVAYGVLLVEWRLSSTRPAGRTGRRKR
jgi:hypothetical protein